MRTNSLRELLGKYLFSLAFPLTISILAYLTWVMPSNWSWLFLPFYFLLVFTPLVCEDGRAYIPLLLYNVVFVHDDLNFNNFPVSMILSIIFFILSLVIFIIIKKPKMVTGPLFFTYLTLFLVFLVSYVYSTVTNHIFDRTPVLYLISFFVLLTLFSLISSVLGKKETMPYFAYTVALFGIVIALETFTKLILTHGFHFAKDDFTLGWAYTKETVSTFLVLTVPFYCILISKKKGYWFIPLALVIITLIFLSTDSGLLSLIFFSVPLVILTLRDYGRAFPYYTLMVLLAIGMTIGILMGVNADFNARVVKAVTKLNLFDQESNIDIIKGWNLFTTNIVIGPSITSITHDNGTILLASNTFISTLILGGLVGFGAYILMEVIQYVTLFRKKAKEKWIILIFLLMINFIGWLNNTIYNLAILLFIFLTLSVYQQSNRPDDVVIHEDFYLSFNKEEAALRNIKSI